MKKMDIFDITVNLEQSCAVLNLTIDALESEIRFLEKEGGIGCLGNTKQLISSFHMVLSHLYDLTEECDKLEVR